MSELQDEIYSDDSWLRLVELNKIDAIIDEALNAVWKKFYRKNRINPEMIKIDKHKDIDGYVSKLTDIINNKIALLNRICDAIDHVMSEIKNERNMIDEKIHKLSEMDNDILLWINDWLKEFINQSGRNLRKIYGTNKVTIQVRWLCHKTLEGISTRKISETIQVRWLCHKTLEGISKAKITSDNTNKIIVSQDFGGNTYSKNSMIIYNINDKFWWLY